jgi:hypothetical protein
VTDGNDNDGLAVKVSPIPRIAPPPLGNETGGRATLGTPRSGVDVPEAAMDTSGKRRSDRVRR